MMDQDDISKILDEDDIPADEILVDDLLLPEDNSGDQDIEIGKEQSKQSSRKKRKSKGRGIQLSDILWVVFFIPIVLVIAVKKSIPIIKSSLFPVISGELRKNKESLREKQIAREKERERQRLEKIRQRKEQQEKKAAEAQKAKEAKLLAQQQQAQLSSEVPVAGGEADSDLNEGQAAATSSMLAPIKKGNRAARKKKKPGVDVQNNIIRSSDALWVAFLVPMLIMIIIFVQRGIFPFGDKSFLRTDMYHQYAPFFSEFHYKLTNGQSLLHSWNIGMGVNFSALYAYYLASPFNWLLIFCPKNYILEFMTYLIVVKIGLAGVSFSYYLRKHYQTKDFGVAFFGIFYALSGYMAAYSWNIMWLDCIILFPLIMLGIERLVREKKCLLYCLTLATAIISNYYISIMICIYMVVYFIVLLILDKKKRRIDYLWNIAHFGIFSLLAGGLAASVLIPEIYALQMTASGDVQFPQTVSAYFSIVDMFARHIGNIDIELGLEHWPNIYCGVAVFIFLFLYFSCKQIRLKEKVIYGCLLLFFFASFSVNVLNFIWHGLHYPNSLPCRQSFIYIFLVLYLCYHAYMHLDKILYRHIVWAFWCAVGFILFAQHVIIQEHFHFWVYYSALLFLAIYAGILYLYKYKRLNTNFLLILVLSVVSIEAAVNMTVTSVTTTSRDAYVNDNAEVRGLMSSIPKNDFYRIEKVDRKTKNDGAWMNFSSVSTFSSTANASLTDFFKLVGCEGNTNAYSITGSTPLVDMLFSVKYGFYSDEMQDELLSFVDVNGGTYLYERIYTLPVAFGLPLNFEDSWNREQDNPADVQNDFAYALGADPVLIPAEGENFAGFYSFTPETDGKYYVFVGNKRVRDVMVYHGEWEQEFKNVHRGYFIELDYCQAGSEVRVELDQDNENLRAQAYRFSSEGLASVYAKLSVQPMTVTNWTDTGLTGSINLTEDATLYTSIPYDKGWKVKVNGSDRTPKSLFDTFISIDLPAGEHNISFEYEPQGAKLGTSITVGSIIFIVALSVGQIMQRWRRRKRNRRMIRSKMNR